MTDSITPSAANAPNTFASGSVSAICTPHDSSIRDSSAANAIPLAARTIESRAAQGREARELRQVAQFIDRHRRELGKSEGLTRNHSSKVLAMHVEFLGGPSGGQGSPRLYLTDRNTFAVQGWKTMRANRIEIPHRLLVHVRPGTCIAGLRDTGHGTFLLSGTPITDPEALEIMKIPSHETAVEVPIAQEVTPDAPGPRG
ncbi:hypothetical protein [Nocardia sp. NPDC046763]|uniref:hypothetical protein n=1 Tax=Nocardia sp. NPDC046763 TaxID=3155256 RepID=UPI0033F86C33